MGIPVLILGESGSGKSASLRNFDSAEVGIFNVASKPLPFRKKLEKTVNGATYALIEKSLSKGALKTYVIDDSQYLIAFDAMSRAKEKGYEKFTDYALNFYNLVKFIINQTSEDTIVYLLHHTHEGEDGKVRAKTIGKMLDSQLSLEGLFSIALLAKADGAKYFFETQTDGKTVAKSPMGMFTDMEIDNDLKAVDTAIREYYEFKTNKKENEE